MATPDRMPQLPPELARALQQGKLVDVLKLLMNSSTLQALKETRASLGKLAGSPSPSRPAASPASQTGFPAAAQQALLRGNKIEAIKRFRESTGANLRDAMTAVDAYQRTNVPRRATASTTITGRRLAPGEVPPENDLPVIVLLVLLALFGVWVFFF
jgi:ribosomal protein L7/L12